MQVKFYLLNFREPKQNHIKSSCPETNFGGKKKKTRKKKPNKSNGFALTGPPSPSSESFYDHQSFYT